MPKANKAIGLPTVSPLGFSVEETARILHVSRSTIIRLCAQKLLDMRKPPGLNHRITEKSLRKYIANSAR